MAMRYGYFDSEITGVDSEGMPIFDRAETSELFRLLFAKLLTNGVLARPGDCFQVVAGDTGLTIKVRPGFGLINGAFAYDSADATYELATAPTKYSRIDRVVLRCNYLERKCEIIVKTGTPAATPVAPELLQPASGDYYELGLALVTISTNQAVMTQSSITDTRADSSVCGYITQLIDHLDTSVFYEQMNQFYIEFVEKCDASYESSKTAMNSYLVALRESGNSQLEEIVKTLWNFEQGAEGDFDTWFQHVKDKLSDDAAGNLQLQIDNLEGAASEAWADGKTIVAENGKLRTNKIYEEHVTEESLPERPNGEKYIDMDVYTEPGFYQFDAFSNSVIKNNVPFETGFLLIVGKGGLYDSREPSYGDVFYQEAITRDIRKYRTGTGNGQWSEWNIESVLDQYVLVNEENGTISFSKKIVAPFFTGTATKSGLLSTKNVTKDADTSVVTGSTVVEEYSADGSSNLPGDGDYIVMTMCGGTNMKAASVAVAEEDGRLCTRGRSNGWKDWNRYIHEADIARASLFNGSIDVGGGVQTLKDGITQYKTVGFFCGRGEQYYHGTMFFGYSTGVRHTIPVGKGYITVTSASPTQIEVLENTTGYALRQIWGRKF